MRRTGSTQSGVFVAGGMAIGPNVGIGVGGGLVRRDIEGPAVNVDVNAKAVSFTGSWDDQGFNGGGVSFGPGVGVSVSVTKTKSLSLQDVVDFFTKPSDTTKPPEAHAQPSAPPRYLELLTYDELGQRWTMRLGNGAVTTYDYYPESRRLRGLATAAAVFDLDAAGVLANFDLHIGKRLWERGPAERWPESLPRGALTFSQEAIEQKSFSLPLRVTCSEDRGKVRIAFGNAPPTSMVGLSDDCVALLSGDYLVGFLARRF